ncbi:MAG: hypothetical protein JWM05_1847 [Acidimicrobiales bacterium]|nr:hypothetical protein [Acidimicrobiales bacterium]
MSNAPARRRLAAASLVTSLLLVGCGASGSSGTKATDPPKDATTAKPTTTAPPTTIDTIAVKQSLRTAIDRLRTERLAQQTRRNLAADKGDVPGAKAAIAAQRTAYFDFDAAVRQIQLGPDQDKLNAVMDATADVIWSLDEFAKLPDKVDASCATCQSLAFRYNQILPVETVAVNTFRRSLGIVAKQLGIDYTDKQLPTRDGYAAGGEFISTKDFGSGSYRFVVPQGFVGQTDSSTISVSAPKKVLISSGIAGNHTDSRDDVTDLKKFSEGYAKAVVDKSGDRIEAPVEKVSLGGIEAYTYTTKGDLIEKSVMFRFGKDIVSISLLVHDDRELARYEPLFDDAMQTLKVSA